MNSTLNEVKETIVSGKTIYIRGFGTLGLQVRRQKVGQFKMIEKMTEEKKSVVKIFLDAFITKDKIKQLAL